MAHWRSVLPAGSMLDVSYEDVVNNLEQQARRLIDYCGLPWDDRCLSFHETSRQIATPSNVQVRQPLYRSSLARWRRYEAYLGPLLSELESLPLVGRGPKRKWVQQPRNAARRSTELDDLGRVKAIIGLDSRQRARTEPMTAASQTPGEPAELDALAALAQREHRAGRLAEAAAAYRQILAAAARRRRDAQQPGQRAVGPGQARRSGGPIRASAGSQARPFPGAQQPGQRPLAAGQARPGRGAASSKRSLWGPILPSRTTTWATCSRTRASWTKRRPEFEQAHRLSGPLLSAAHTAWATSCWKQDKLDEAAARFEQAVALRPDLAEAHNNLGNVLWTRASSTRPWPVSRGVGSSTRLSEAHNNLGNALKQQGKFDEAAARYEQALALRPDFAEAHYNRASLKTFRADDRRSRRARGAGRRHPAVCLPARCCTSILRSARRWKTSAITHAPSSICSRAMR